MDKVNYKHEYANLRENALDALSAEFDSVTLCTTPNHNEMRYLPIKGEILIFCGWRLVERNGFSWVGALFASESIPNSYIFVAKGKIVQDLEELYKYTCLLVNKKVVIFE